MTKELFGSDGARGPYEPQAGPGAINEETFEGLAYEYARLTREQTDERPTFVIGGDTRSSTPRLAAAASRGVMAAGGNVVRVGVAPTPTIGWIAQQEGINAIAITASHNPDADNGFKPFDAGGVKPNRATLDEVEARYWNAIANGRPTFDGGHLTYKPGLKAAYLQNAVDMLSNGDQPLRDKLVVVDGANGAASELAPELYRALGAEVVQFACDPYGVINHKSGAAHLDGLQEFLAQRPELTSDPRFLGGFANDGDADRIMGVDAQGREINGNHWMNMLATYDQRGIVGTLYTNSGLREAVTGRGIEFHECANGDANVTAMLRDLTTDRGTGFTRGGEFTGHMIDTTWLDSGDGIAMGGRFAIELASAGTTLADAHDATRLWPEVMEAVRTDGANAKAVVANEAVQNRLAELQEEFGTDARTVLRASGTEPVIRVWTEARSEPSARHIVSELRKIVSSQISLAE